ncbi:SMI1/KNR4 family protein [Lacibacter luteus]|uniref:SMI1/KNR4 family protein n=1 Tax=Lacibacter luteus TaxID=2508719 RepID=A0A4Q1CJA7_9BACT|nr:SMI1/KNR4 family protein [Lacibacter luteus]RXK60643.1 SMI1/KNR4 family protein [Lacibacter luteus]
MNTISNIEQTKGIILPDLYKDFYRSCSIGIPEKLIGSDLPNHYLELEKFAKELLADNSVINFLEPDDFVFIMHQGYQFWYFKADGKKDPIVYGYTEGNTQPDNFGVLSKFITELINSSRT